VYHNGKIYCAAAKDEWLAVRDFEIGAGTAVNTAEFNN
jgi:hypothetical protein